jgi:molybdate transport system permease protein
METLTPHDWAAIRLTLELAAVTTVILLLIGTPLAWWLAHTRHWARNWVEAAVALPLVLPPTVLGFYLLITLGPNGAVGQLWAGLGGRQLTFSFSGLVIGSVLFSLPFVVQPLQNAFAALGTRPLEVAATLRAGLLDRFFSVVLPLSWPGFLSAITLSFAHTVGEFGVVLMLGGSIPGRTQVLSIAIYEHVETLNFGHAHILAGGMLFFSFITLLLLYSANRGRFNKL